MKKKILIILLFFFLLLILALQTNLFKNVKLIFINSDIRIVNQYGYCGGESIGYLKYLKKKYKFQSNPKIINFIHTPQVKWAIYNPKNYKKSNYTIILNYPGKIFYKNLIFLRDNYFEIQDPHFLGTITNQILNIKFLNTDYVIKKLNFYKTSDQNSLIFIKELSYNKGTKTYPINLKINDFDVNEFKLILEIIGEKKFDASNKIQISLENIIDIEKENIIDSHKNCYLIKMQ